MNQQSPAQTPSLKVLEIEKTEDTEPPGSHLFSAFKNNTKLIVTPIVANQGVDLTINNFSLSLSYPDEIWRAYPQPQRRVLAENLAFCFTFFLPYLLPEITHINYLMPIPIADPFLFKGFSYSIPSIALMQNHPENQSTINLLRRLFTIEYNFINKKTSIPPLRRNSNPKNIVIPFSFGKDSLLTLALCQEIGLKPYPIYIAEPDYQFEYLTKKASAEQFASETGITVSFFENTLGALRETDGYVGWELQLTHYSLMLLPYVYAYNAGFIIFANEQSCNDTVIDNDGFRYNPVYEQSHSWLLQNSVLASLVGGNSLTIGSMIEPLYELAIIKILHNRYPILAKYQMSCDLEDKEGAELENKRWCESCSKCARIFIFLLAHAINPKTVGFNAWLLEEKYSSLYPIFDMDADKSYGYDQSGAGKDEQLLAYHLAFKQGFKGPLIDRFVKEFGEEVKRRESLLRQKFFGIHSTTTVPSPFRKKILSIFHQELDHLAR